MELARARGCKEAKRLFCCPHSLSLFCCPHSLLSVSLRAIGYGMICRMIMVHALQLTLMIMVHA
jgi:hypothetical protein